MGEVIDINKNQPHLSGDAVCLACKHKWVAVAPTGTYVLDCPECGLGKGIYGNLAVPNEYWMCRCGCCHFFVTKTEIKCAICALAQVL